MNHFHPSTNDAATYGILNTIREETVEVQATTVLDSSHEQAMDNRETGEVRRP